MLHSAEHITLFQFLRYLKLKLENGYTIDSRVGPLYDEYIKYCRKNLLYTENQKKFLDTLGKIGIDTIMRWSKTDKKNYRRKDISLNKLNEVLSVFSTNIYTQRSFMLLDGKEYEMSITILPTGGGRPKLKMENILKNSDHSE